MSEVNSPSFEIHLADGTVNEYIQSDQIKYHWTVGNSGILMVFRDVMHAMFAVSLKQDERIEAFNANQWDRVYALDDEVTEEGDTTQDQVDDSVIAMS